jgi:spore coat polysaccharide biosynthesis protein SpsF (cytidylyltransferase family)
MQILNKNLQKKIIAIRNDISNEINRYFNYYKAYNGIDSNILKNGLYRYCWWGIKNYTYQLEEKLDQLLKNHKYKDIIDSYKLKKINNKYRFTIYFKIDKEILIEDYYKMFIQLKKDIEKIKSMKKRLNNINNDVKRGVLKKDIEGKKFIHQLIKNQTFDMWSDIIKNKEEESWINEWHLDPNNFKNEKEYNYVIQYLCFRDKI